MPRDFNIRFDNVEVIGGSDNLLENTNVTKVSMVGDNKMSSLGATFKNCKDLDIIEGSINLNGIDVINEILNGTQYVKSIRLENVNSPNISANLSFPHIESINFDKTYNKIAIQNVLGGCVWNIKDINYYGVVGNSVVNETVSVNNDINISILNSLEKTCREFEIHGNTFENLVDGMVERELSDGIGINMDNTKNVFPMKVVNNIRVDKIEGDSLFNLVDGEKVESLDDSVNRVIMDSDFSFNETKNKKYSINEIQGNTWQDSGNLSNIKHLGELYVDGVGNPILDSEGKKQYKYDIVSNNANFIDEDNSNKNQRYFEYYNIDVNDKKEYTIFYLDSNKNTGEILVDEYDEKGIKIGSTRFLTYSWKANYMPTINTAKINIKIDTWWTDGVLNNKPNMKIMMTYRLKDITEQEGELIYIPHKSSTKSILLPYQLKKVGDIADRLYWDNIKVKYCIEEKTIKHIINGDSTIVATYSDDKYPNVIGASIINPNVFKQRCPLMSNIFKYNGTSPIDVGRLVSNDEKIYVRDYIFVSIKKEKLVTVDKNGINKYFTDNSLTIYGESNSPQIIYTDIKSPIKINSYKDKTYLSFNNNINPSSMDIKSGNKAFYDINLKSNTLYTIQLDLFLESNTPSQLSINLGGKILNENITEDVFNKLIKITTNSTLANNNLTIVGEGLICQNVMLFETDLKVAVNKYVNGEQHVGEEIIDYFDGNEIEINNPQYKYKLENMIGNTWQDYNIPNSLKSVGELYVDSGGLPILDSEGKEQYKVDAVARNKGLTSNIKKTILLPKQLHYIKTLYNGEVANTNNTIVYDELYWDDDFNKYMIKENIKEYITSNINYNGETNIMINLPSDMKSEINANSDCCFIMDGIRVKGWNSTSKNTDLAIRRNGANNYICLATTGIFTNLEVSQKLSNKKILYQTTKPKIIETNITEKLTFNDIDYFTPYTKFELDNFKSDIKLSNKYYLIDLKTSTYDIEGRDIVW